MFLQAAKDFHCYETGGFYGRSNMLSFEDSANVLFAKADECRTAETTFPET